MKKRIEPHTIYAYQASNIILGISALLSFIILIMMFAPIEVLKPNIQPYKSITKVVEPNQQYVYEVDSCKLKDVPSEVTRTFIDASNGVQYPPVIGRNNISTGCNKTNISIVVPSFIPPGTYYLALDILYHINLFRDKIYHLRTENFKVASPSAKSEEYN